MKASQTETVIMLTCCALQSACYSPTGIVISFILAQIQGEVQTNLTVKRFLMCSAALCTYSAERIIYNFAFVALCGALQTHFHGKGRRGEMAGAALLSAKAQHGGGALPVCTLIRRYAPPSPDWGKASAAEVQFPAKTQSLRACLCPLGGAVAQRLRGFKSAEPEKTVKRSSRRTGVNLQFFPV